MKHTIGNKYYYTDNTGNEWEFKEKNVSTIHYYFVCSTAKCNAFGKILRIDEKRIHLDKAS